MLVPFAGKEPLQLQIYRAFRIRRAEADGIGLYSAARYFIGEPERQGFLLGYGTLDEREIEEGVRRLSKILASSTLCRTGVV